MGTVIMHDVVSLDGFIADDHDDVGPLHDWYFSGDTPLIEGSAFRMSRVSSDHVRSMWAAIGCLVIGRHLFDLMDGWDGHPPVGDHVVVVSHRPKPAGWHPDAPYHFVDNVADAIARAQQLAGERTISVNAGEVGGQILAAGLVDEIAMDLVPVVFGSGKRFFGSTDGRYRLADPHLVIQGERVLHLMFAASKEDG